MIELLVTMVCSGGFALLGYWMGFRAGERGERRAAPKPLEAVCSCGHGYGKHRPGECGGTTTVRREWNDGAGVSRYEDQVLVCGCGTYDGPDPETVRMIRGA